MCNKVVLHTGKSAIQFVLKEAQRAAKGKPPSGQAASEEPKVTKDPVKAGGSNEPTKSKSELKAERRAIQV